MTGHQPAVYDNHTAIDKSSLIRAEVESALRDIGRCTKGVRRVQSTKLRFRLGVLCVVLSCTFREDRARANGIDPNSKLSILICQKPGERKHSTLGGGVRGKVNTSQGVY